MPGVITGKHILYDVSLVVNSVDLSDHVESVEFMVGTNKQPGAAMSEIQDYSMAGTVVVSDPRVTFYQDYAAAKVYATLIAARPLNAAPTVFNLVGKASSAAKSPTNPEWTIPVFVGEMPLMTGTRGDRHMAPVTFAVAGQASIATS